MGDLKWSEFVKSLKATDQPYFFQRIFFLLLSICLPISINASIPILISALLINQWTVHIEDILWLQCLRGTAYLVLPAISLTTIHDIVQQAFIRAV